MDMLTEIDLRSALRAYLAEIVASIGSGRIVEELCIERGSARIDVALITTCLTGFEIKSDFDSLDRFSNQVHAYNRVFDEITLVTGTALLKDALRLLPPWWGIIAASQCDDGSVALNSVRGATKNPAQQGLSIAMLLWKAEALEVLAPHTSRSIPAKVRNSELHAMLAEAIPVGSLQPLVASKLMARSAWRTPEPSEPCDDWSHLDATSIGSPT